MLQICLNSLTTYGQHPIIESQVKQLIQKLQNDNIIPVKNLVIKVVPPPVQIADEAFKEAFIEIMLSNYRLGCAEYKRNTAYNDTHYHYKAEEKMMYYLQDNYPELWKEIGKRILEIDSKQSV